MKASPSLCFFLALMLLLQSPVAAMNWQGTGNMNNDNLTVIWAFINSNLKRLVDEDVVDTFNTELSEDLNGRWAPAWNVVTVHLKTAPSTYNDVILYGYAFKDHWMWYNGHVDPLIPGQSFSFVIWKDYNCQGWQTVGKNGGLTGFIGMQSMWLNTWVTTVSINDILNDPWVAAKKFLTTVQTSDTFVVEDNHAFSIVLSQSYVSTDFYGRVCVVGNKQYYSAGNIANYLASKQGIGYGSFLIFQTR